MPAPDAPSHPGKRRDGLKYPLPLEAEPREKVSQLLFAGLRCTRSAAGAQIAQRRITGGELLKLMLCEITDAQVRALRCVGRRCQEVFLQAVSCK